MQEPAAASPTLGMMGATLTKAVTPERTGTSVMLTLSVRSADDTLDDSQ